MEIDDSNVTHKTTLSTHKLKMHHKIDQMATGTPYKESYCIVI